MNKAVIKSFAVEARKKLIASVKDKAGRIGIAKENITEVIRKGEGYAVFPTHIGIETTLVGKELKQRENLVNRIQEKGYESVMEEVAYTWFNRIIAVRFMEVNDYLPSRIRVLSSETKGKFEPDIVTQAPIVDIELTDQEIEEIISLKEKNELDKLFRQLFIKQCNVLGEILPELFENTSKYNKDYTEILLDISYTNEDGVIRDLLKIDEEDFLEAVEIIGWMYQYYNTEPKDETFALLKKNVKITKERIPSATQLFTPDWIVRYMVENSLGRLWLEGHPNETLKTDWKYYLDEVAQEPDVIRQLEKIKTEYKNIKPEEIMMIDPCMGSGHILVYAFEVLMQIYESCGYTQRDAASSIVERNLYGLDIDDRAYQLAYFAVMMKGRKYDRRFLTKGITPNLSAIQESNCLNSFEQGAGQLEFDSLHKETANYLIETYRDAKEYGSILNIEQRDYDGLLAYIEQLENIGSKDLFMASWVNNISTVMTALIKQVKTMTRKYDVVVTNPPYMGSSGMGPKLSDFVKHNYPDTKADLFSCCIEKGFQMAKPRGFVAMITMESWMFLSSFEKMRYKILSLKTIANMVHMPYLGKGGTSLGINFGTAAFVFTNRKVNNYSAQYNYICYYETDEKGVPFSFPTINERYKTAITENFSKIPGMPIAYWVSNNLIKAFEKGKSLGTISNPCQGLSTSDNNRFLRIWSEVNISKIGFDYNNSILAQKSQKKWFPFNKGGSYRKWYGNNEYIVNYENNGEEIKKVVLEKYPYLNTADFVIKNQQYYFQKGLTWSALTSGTFSIRYFDDGFIFADKGQSLFSDDKIRLFLCGVLNSKVSNKILALITPTLDFNCGYVRKIPIIFSEQYKLHIDDLVSHNIFISKTDWDSLETSWGFKTHLLINKEFYRKKIQDAFISWQRFTEKQFTQLKINEEKLNRIFIETYSLQDELKPEVEDKDITINKVDLQRDIRSFVSYAVGCMLGRYSLDVEGLAYAGGKWDDSKYKTFTPDKENIIPITDEEYFDNDIVARFVDFVRVVYGEDALEENLDFIANALGNKGTTSREVIRNYFIKDFFKDHVKTYRKRPIYWLFDSGKENGFNALIYLHRYDEDTVGRVRADYLHKSQASIENAIANYDVVLESNAPASDKAKAVKQKEKLVKQLAETRIYDQAIAHIAHQRISLDLDDGVVANYAKFQGIEISSEGKKSVKVNLLGKI